VVWCDVARRDIEMGTRKGSRNDGGRTKEVGEEEGGRRRRREELGRRKEEGGGSQVADWRQLYHTGHR